MEAPITSPGSERKARRRRSAIDRLRRLPAVFTTPLACRVLDMSPRMLSVYLARDAARGLVRRAGPRSRVWYNLLVDPDGPETRRGEAAALAYPGVLLYGVSVLHAAGWISQIPKALHVAVPSGLRSWPKLDGVEVHPRPRRWFRALAEAGKLLRPPPFPAHGLPAAMAPEAAWRDMVARGETCGLDEDDLVIGSASAV